MTEQEWIVVRKWERFQHYRERNPIWIKNYTELLHDDEYRALTGHQRSVLHGLWLEYASAQAQLKLSTTSLTYRLGLRVTRSTLESLKDAGFIEFSASKPLAHGYQDASATRALAREEREREKKDLLHLPNNHKPHTPTYVTLERLIRNGAHAYSRQSLQEEIAKQEEKHGHLKPEQRDQLLQLAAELENPE